jgi:hypothetical protein
MSSADKALLVLFLGLYLLAFGLYHFIVFRVNRNLPSDRRIPHSLYWGGWNRVRSEYTSLYPRSRVYQFTVWCSAVLVILAGSFCVLRFWGYLIGR